jgi:hypothetical protein
MEFGKIIVLGLGLLPTAFAVSLQPTLRVEPDLLTWAMYLEGEWHKTVPEREPGLIESIFEVVNDDSPWLDHVWDTHEAWDGVVIAGQIRAMREWTQERYRAAADDLEVGFEDTEPLADAPEVPGAQLTFASVALPSGTALLTVALGCIGLGFVKPQTLPVRRPRRPLAKRPLVPLERAERHYPGLRMRR